MYVICDVCGQDQFCKHDHKPDHSGLDDGPPLPRRVINERKRARIRDEWKAGATLRELAAKYAVSHETVRVWTKNDSRKVGASRRPHRKT